MLKINLSFLPKLWRLTRTYWCSEEKWRAGLLLAVIIAMNLANVYILVQLNVWNNRFYNALQNYDKSAFFSALGDFCWLAAAFIIVAVYEQYLQQMLTINWRRWLTRHYLQNWLSKQTYYRMQLLDAGTDNPDQRISEDLRLFVSSTLTLSLGLMKAAVTLASFVAILWQLSGSLTIPFGDTPVVIPGYLVWAAVGYAIVGTWLAARIGQPLIGINFNQQRYEADFRFSLVRLRENSESIAFYRGEQQEEHNFIRRFDRVFANFWELMRRQKKLTWFSSGYAQIAIIFPFLVAVPRYFSNQLQLGGLLQTASAFGRVQEALSYFVASYAALAEWQAVVNRLLTFVDNMEQVRSTQEQTGVEVTPVAGTTLAVNGLSVALPNTVRLIDELNLEIRPGDSLLIVGPSGCGKSTLLRTIAGLWPFGQGRIDIPQDQSMLFLPQKSYLPLGTLREAVLYPYGADWAPDETVRAVLESCQLGELVEHLDKMENWAQILSLGEQQRVAFARAILQRPQWLFLDEATSALDEPAEAVLYQLLRHSLGAAAIISVGHRPGLVRHHNRLLRFDGAGRWALRDRSNGLFPGNPAVAPA